MGRSSTCIDIVSYSGTFCHSDSTTGTLLDSVQFSGMRLHFNSSPTKKQKQIWNIRKDNFKKYMKVFSYRGKSPWTNNLIGLMQKYAWYIIITMAFWAICKIQQPIVPIWLQLFALSWSAFNKPSWKLHFLHIFEIPSSSCHMLQRFWGYFNTLETHCCPIHLYLIFEKSSWKNQVWRTGFLVYFELDF